MVNSANSNSVSGVAALINVQKPSSAAQTQGERKVLPEAPVEDVKTSGGNQQRSNSGQDDNSAKESSFSKLIVSDPKEPVRSTQRSNNNAATASASSPASATETAEDGGTATDESTTVTTETTFSSIMLVLIQLQNIPQKDAPESVSACTDKTDAANDNADQITGSLEELITRLLALLEKLGGQKPTADTGVTQVNIAVVQQVQVTSCVTVTQDVAVNSQPLVNAAQPATGEVQDATALPAATDTADNGATTNEVDMSEIMAMLQSILQQLGVGKATDATKPVDTAAADDDIAVEEAGSDKAVNIPAGLTEALGKLADLLEQKFQPEKAAKPTTPDLVLPTKANAEKATASDITLPVTPKQVPLSAGNTQPERNAFQQVLERLGSILAPKDDTSADTTSNNTSTPAVVHAPQQNVQDSSFTKIVQQQPTPHAPAVPAQDQVLVNIKNAVADGLSQIKIQLHPEELGKVEVHLTTSADGKTGISITADNRQTLSMLQNEARALQDALRDIGLKTDAGGLNFNLRDSQQDARNSSKQQQGGYTQVAGVDDIEETGFSTAGALYRLSVQNGLDIRV